MNLHHGGTLRDEFGRVDLDFVVILCVRQQNEQEKIEREKKGTNHASPEMFRCIPHEHPILEQFVTCRRSGERVGRGNRAAANCNRWLLVLGLALKGRGFSRAVRSWNGCGFRR
jgi:hypothetical protein